MLDRLAAGQVELGAATHGHIEDLGFMQLLYRGVEFSFAGIEKNLLEDLIYLIQHLTSSRDFA